MVESTHHVTTQGSDANNMRLDRSWFIQSRQGNIKDHYFFEKKLGSGGYGAVYLAVNKLTGRFSYFAPLAHRILFVVPRGQDGCESHAEGQDLGLRIVQKRNQHLDRPCKCTICEGLS